MAHGLKSLSVGAPAAYVIPLDKIRVRPGFNLRMRTPDLEEHIDSLRQAYVNGDPVPPIVVKFTDGFADLVDGHCRYEGACRAVNLDGAEMKGITCISAPAKEEDQLAYIFKSQDNKKLSVLEKAVGVQRFLAWNWTMADISKKLGVSTQTLKDWLSVAETSPEIQQMVADGVVKPTEVVRLLREEGQASATATLQLAAEEAKTNGNGKVTAKTINAVREASGGAPPVRKTAAKERAGTAEATTVTSLAAPVTVAQVAAAIAGEDLDLAEVRKRAIEAFLAEWEHPDESNDLTLDEAIDVMRVSVGRPREMAKVRKAA
jgi:lambda repressor-like predicted transcriptional regulator